MKKNRILTSIILATFIISIIAFAPVNAATEAAPAVFPLYAGQSILVGEVQVWEDANYLYVKYITDAPWVMSETHLAYATIPDDIPQTKNGNPIPGKFEFSDPHGLVYEYTYQIDRPAIGTICIAAHAKVWDTSSITTLSLVSGAGSAKVYGPKYTYLPLNDAGWGTSVPSVVTWKHPGWPLIGGSAVWISSAYYIEIPQPDSWRKFEVNFDVPGIPLGGEVVTATADNAEAVYFNGALIGSDGTVDTPYDANVLPSPEWGTIQDYAILPISGANKLEFIVHNYEFEDNPVSNPTGLIYKADVCYIEKCESAWAGTGIGTIAFDGKNWATYFIYTVQGSWIEVDTITVPATIPTGADSYIILDATTQYKFVVTGSYWRNTGGSPNQLCDAEYTTYETENWAPYHDGCVGYTTGWLSGWTTLGANFADLQVNGGFVEWGPFSLTHEYTYSFGAGTGSAANFRIFDGYGDTNIQMPSWYGDNAGSLTVKIYALM